MDGFVSAGNTVTRLSAGVRNFLGLYATLALEARHSIAWGGAQRNPKDRERKDNQAPEGWHR